MTDQPDVPPPPDGSPPGSATPGAPSATSPGAAADRLRAVLTDRLGTVPLPPTSPSGAAPLLRPGGPVAAVVREKKRWATVQAPPPAAQDDRKERLDNVDRLLRDCLRSARQAGLAEVRRSGLPWETGDERWFLPPRETVTAWLADEVAALAAT